jgi:hypothetical protein
VGALTNPEVGKFINENCVSSFQKVATFKIVGNQKQGGNVASYFCAPDGRVLHVIPGPVDAGTMLREAKWIVGVTEKAIAEAKGDGAKFKAIIRKAHADRLLAEHGLQVEPVTFDPPVEQDPNSALTYNDPTGRPLAPKLPPPPIDGPDVRLNEVQNRAALAKQAEAAKAPGARDLVDRKGGRWQLGNVGRAHMLLAVHGMGKLETMYGTVFQEILGERISTRPVEVVTPFPWREERGNPNVRLKSGG